MIRTDVKSCLDLKLEGELRIYKASYLQLLRLVRLELYNYLYKYKWTQDAQNGCLSGAFTV